MNLFLVDNEADLEETGDVMAVAGLLKQYLVCQQGSYWSWETWKVMEFCFLALPAWKVMEFYVELWKVNFITIKRL